MWVRGYRAPRPEDEAAIERVKAALAERLLEWEALDTVPSEEIPPGWSTVQPHLYGYLRCSDLFSPRQLYGHCGSVEIFRELLEEGRAHHGGDLPEITRAAFGYLALSLDKMRPSRKVIATSHR